VVDTQVVTREAGTQDYTSQGRAVMSEQQTYGVALLLVGFALLIESAGIAWALARRSRSMRVEGAGLIKAVSFALFVVGVLLCGLGADAIVDGARLQLEEKR